MKKKAYKILAPFASYLNRKVLFSLFCVIALLFALQAAVFHIPYFQALAQCLDPSDPRADFLITSSTQGSSNRFTSRIGTCIFDPQASIGEFRQTSYQQLFEEFYIKSRIPQAQKFSYPPTGDNSPFILNTTTTLGDESLYLVKENFYVDGTPTAPAVTTLVFIEKDLHIRSNFTYGSPNEGLVFIVKGSVYFSTAVTRFDGVIIAQGGQSNNFGICTGTDASGLCPVSSVDVGTNALVVNGSLIALDKNKPIRFTRKLNSNVIAAEQVNHQVKYLSILNNLLSKPTNVVSEGTNYAICTATINKPPGCPCDPASAEQPQCVGGASLCQSNICQPPTGPIQGGTNAPVQVSCNSACSTAADCSGASNGCTACKPNAGGGNTCQQPDQLAPEAVPPRLVAHWTLDEETGSIVRDHVGGNHGSTPGSTVVGGRFGLARELANGSFITVNDSPAFRSQYTTVSAWIYPKNLSLRPSASIFERRNAQNSSSILLQLDNTLDAQGRTGVQCFAKSQRAHSASIKLELRTWNHIVCTYDGSEVKLFLSIPDQQTDARQVGSASAPGFLDNPQNPSIQIGRNISTGQSFVGFMDEIKVYSYALSLPEINTLFKQTPAPGVPSNNWTNPWQIFTERQVDEYIIHI
jgi:hypothetical protein